MMHTRIDTISFRSPFTLPGLDKTYPAGTYEVATDEEQLDLSFAAFRRIETRIRLPSGAETYLLADCAGRSRENSCG